MPNSTPEVTTTNLAVAPHGIPIQTSTGTGESVSGAGDAQDFGFRDGFDRSTRLTTTNLPVAPPGIPINTSNGHPAASDRPDQLSQGRWAAARRTSSDAGSAGIRRRPHRTPLPLALGQRPPSSAVPVRLLRRSIAGADGALVRLPRGVGLAWRGEPSNASFATLDVATAADPARPGTLVRAPLTARTAPTAAPQVRRTPSPAAPHHSIVAPGPGMLERAIRRRATDATDASEATDTTDTTEAPAMPPLARDFLAELGRHRREQPRPLPVQFRPIAARVVGPRRVMVSTDAASRRALRRVGKVAATTDEVIHLDRAPSAASPELIAHELAHIAHPSPTPRFFADPVRGPEERQAEEIARVMRTAPVLPSVAGAGDTQRPAAAVSAAPANTVQRSMRSSSDTVTAAGLAARISGAAAPDVVRRFTTTAADIANDVAAPVAPTQQAPATQSAFTGLTTTDSLDQFQRLVEMLEERIIVELERRGGRFRGGL